MRRVVLTLIAAGSLGVSLLAGAAENLEMWYDAQGKAVAILPEEKPAEEFVSTWERRAEERKQRAEGRKSTVRRSSGGRDYYFSDWSGYDYGYVSTPYFRYFQPRSYPVYQSPCRWYGGYRGSSLRVNIRIH